MKTIVISMQNSLLSSAISKYLVHRGELIPVQVLNHQQQDEPFITCKSLKADVLLMDITLVSNFTLEQRLNTTKQIKKFLPKCKVAFMIDDHSHPDLAEGIKDLKKLGMIDGFFHSSLTGEYISAALDAL